MRSKRSNHLHKDRNTERPVLPARKNKDYRPLTAATIACMLMNKMQSHRYKQTTARMESQKNQKTQNACLPVDQED